MGRSRELAWKVRRGQHRHRLRRLVASLDHPILMTGLPGNIGDHLIWAGIDAALGDLFVERIPLAAVEGARGQTLVVPGSGAWSAHYHEWLPALVASAASRFDTVLILPSSFDVRVPAVHQALSLANVVPMARERVSMAAVSGFRSCTLGPDCSVYAPLGSRPDPARPVPNGELLCLRTDSESALPRELYEISSGNNDISATAPDLGAWLQAIRASAGVITDRAHVMLAGTLLGKRVRYLEGAYWKVCALADYTFGSAFAQRLRPTTLDELTRERRITGRSESGVPDRSPAADAARGAL